MAARLHIVHEAPGSVCSTDESDKVAQPCNPVILEVKAWGSKVQGHLWLHGKFENTLRYKRKERWGRSWGQ